MEAKASDNLIDKEMEGIDKIQKKMDEKYSLIKQINQLNDKIKKQEKSNSDKDKEKKECEKNNINDEQKLKVINNYKSLIFSAKLLIRSFIVIIIISFLLLFYCRNF